MNGRKNDWDTQATDKSGSLQPFITIPETQLESSLEARSMNSQASQQNVVYSRTNHTLDSLGKNLIIIIKPTAENDKDRINNPIKFQSELQKSEFGESLTYVKDIRTNRKLNIIG